MSSKNYQCDVNKPCDIDVICPGCIWPPPHTRGLFLNKLLVLIRNSGIFSVSWVLFKLQWQCSVWYVHAINIVISNLCHLLEYNKVTPAHGDIMPLVAHTSHCFHFLSSATHMHIFWHLFITFS